MTLTIDTSKLEKAIARRILFQDRASAEIINTSAYYIALRAEQNTPFVKQQSIDTELEHFRVPQITRSGKATGRMAHKIGLGNSRPKWSSREVPLSVLIIQARAIRGTRNRFVLKQSPFKGVSRQAGRAAMTRAIVKMVKARHSSTHFIQSGWVDAIRQLAAYAIRNRAVGFVVSPSSDFDFRDRSGRTSRATTGNPRAVCENATGDEETNSKDIHRAILDRGALKALQNAVDQEERGMTAWMEKHIEVLNKRFSAV